MQITFACDQIEQAGSRLTIVAELAWELQRDGTGGNSSVACKKPLTETGVFFWEL
jgi:hypothetical protein